MQTSASLPACLRHQFPCTSFPYYLPLSLSLLKLASGAVTAAPSPPSLLSPPRPTRLRLDLDGLIPIDGRKKTFGSILFHSLKEGYLNFWMALQVASLVCVRTQ